MKISDFDWFMGVLYLNLLYGLERLYKGAEAGVLSVEGFPFVTVALLDQTLRYDAELLPVIVIVMVIAIVIVIFIAIVIVIFLSFLLLLIRCFILMQNSSLLIVEINTKKYQGFLREKNHYSFL